jgi:hypothetical protein
MTDVLGASVALKWGLPEPDSPKARQLRDDLVRNLQPQFPFIIHLALLP